MEIHQAAALYLAHRRKGKPFNPAQFGFEFSTAQIEGYVAALEQLDRSIPDPAIAASGGSEAIGMLSTRTHPS